MDDLTCALGLNSFCCSVFLEFAIMGIGLTEN